MKNIFLVLLFLTFSANIALSEEKSTEDFFQIQLMIDSDFKLYYPLIQEKAQSLSIPQKMFIYDENSKGWVLPTVLNLPGFGLGSWLIGDYTSGTVGLIGNGIGIILASTGEEGAVAVGAVIYWVSTIYNLFSPNAYVSDYNQKLKSALGLNNLSSISLKPTVNYAQNGTVYPALNLSISF